MFVRLAVFAAAIAFSSSALAQGLTERRVSLDMALRAAQKALDECGPTVSVAVVDNTGAVRAFLRGDHASDETVELARRKAATASAFGRTSLEWAERKQGWVPGQRMFWSIVRFLHAMIFLGIPSQGGKPIKVDHNTILLGGVGVSGSSRIGQDEICSKAGVEFGFPDPTRFWLLEPGR
jgi:uncharacterized protein GlcG (DUF336 family)